MFDYSKVRGKIREKFNTQDEFASAMGFSKTTLSYKLNNKVEWTQKEIEKAEIPLYFLTQKFKSLNFKKGENHGN